MRTIQVVVTAAIVGLTVASAALQTPSPQEAPRPIEAGTSLWTEELTWMEVRDAVRAGNTTILIGTGGVEQNGPYLAGGKHNFVLATVMPEIAKAIGKTLIAPIVKFVPEGAIEPTPRGHMSYPGTISLEAATFEALLTDICRSYKAHGFKDIILIGDSGGNQTGMRNVAAALNKKWETETAPSTSSGLARVHYLPEYYTEDQWSYDFLKSQGIVQIDKSGAGGSAGSAHRHAQRHARRHLLRSAVGRAGPEAHSGGAANEGRALHAARRGPGTGIEDGGAGQETGRLSRGDHCAGVSGVTEEAARRKLVKAKGFATIGNDREDANDGNVRSSGSLCLGHKGSSIPIVLDRSHDLHRL